MEVDNELQHSNITAASEFIMLQQLPPPPINSNQFVDDQEEEGQLIMQIDNQHTIQQTFLLPSAMIRNNEDEVNMKNIPITSDRIEELLKVLVLLRNQEKGLEINQKVEFTAVRSCSKRYELKFIVDKCGWNVRATRIKKFHTIQEHVRDKKIEVTPAFVENEMKKKFGIDIGYHKALRANQKVVACIKGSPEENYQILPSYLHMMVCKNPGTYTSIKRDAQNRFAYMFFAPAASIQSENNEAYIWFFEEMRKAIQVRHELVFFSDRNQSIANEIRKVFPEAHHGICLYRFEKNLKQRHAKATVINLFQSAARPYKREDFNQLMSQLKSIDKKTYNYIMEEPPEIWARSWFPRRRYDMLKTNMVESMNSVLLKWKEMLILRMLDFIQEKLGEWFYERRKKTNETFHRVSIWAEEEMTKKIDLACKMFVFNLDSMLFRINSKGIEFIVDLKKRTCD
ncbi:uncharacterized protein [Nicotiana sylvestris]|uniref:uncharacterized protein n=1 Tax=Nicotiana sylvestris TaxID=4096 RepID=UPI00388C8AE7